MDELHLSEWGINLLHTRKSVSKVERQKKKKKSDLSGVGFEPTPTCVWTRTLRQSRSVWCLLPRHGPLATGGLSAILAADGLHRGKW